MTLRVNFEPPVSGGLPISLISGEDTLSFIASHLPANSLSNLVSALIAVMISENGQAVVCWNTEPMEYEFLFEILPEHIDFSVVQWLDSRRRQDQGWSVFRTRNTRRQLALSFWRALRQLESSSHSTWQWPYPFPTDELRKLEQYL
jgi:hypothetical protein